MEASKADIFSSTPDNTEKEGVEQPDAVTVGLGAAASTEHAPIDLGDGGGLDPDHHTHSSDFVDSFVS